MLNNWIRVLRLIKSVLQLTKLSKAEQQRKTDELIDESLQAQLENLLDFEGDNPARIVNNLDWTGDLGAIDLLCDIGKHFRMGTMLAKDVVARRLAG